MNLNSCEKKEKNVAEIIVEIDAEEYDGALNDAYKKNKSQISVPGFRKGKAPRRVVEAMYGADAFYNDALDIILPSVLTFAVKESELRLVSFPQVTDVDIKEEGNVIFTISASVYPEITLGEYKGISAVKPRAAVEDSEVEEELASVRQRNARIETVSRPAQDGDTAVIDYVGSIDGVPFEGGKGEKYELLLGSKTFIPGFEEKLLGMSAGEERELDIVFPENYAEQLAGKAAVFKVTLHEVKEKLLPELDDEFAKDVSEFDTIEEYKADIRLKLEKDKQNQSDIAFENALMEKMIATLEGDIPDSMIEDYMDGSMEDFNRQVASYGMDPTAYLGMMNTNAEAFRESMREPSEMRVKAILALEKIAELENIEVSGEEIEDEYKAAAERYGAELDVVKKSVSEEEIIRDVKRRKAAKIVVDNGIAEEPSAENNEPEEKKTKPRKPRKTKIADDSASAEGKETESKDSDNEGKE